MNFKSILSSTWTIPVIVFVLSIFGLLSALIGDAIWDVLSWLTLGVPVILMSWSLLKPAEKQVT
jgi:hypothetical protein